VIFNRKRQWMFIHNPKAAGTSIRRALFQYDDNPLKLEYQKYIPKLERIVEIFHVCAGDWSSVWPEEPDLLDFFKFGFVRDPYSRLASSWAEHKRQHNLPPDTDFNKWAQTHLTPVNVRFDWRYIHFCPQHYFFYHNNTLCADWIGSFEDLQRQWSLLGWALDLDLPELSHFKDQKTYDVGDLLKVQDLHEDTLRIVNTIYQRDFHLFGYAQFGPSSKPKIHAEVVENLLTQELKGTPTSYRSEDDIRNLSLGEQCMFWRTQAINSGWGK